MNNDHYDLNIDRFDLTVECGNHNFKRDCKQEGPCICPVCGRRFVLSWRVSVEPAPPGYKGAPSRVRVAEFE